ncbi:head-tail connector protein [Terribacillus sp. AE2B 122]|uniref:head-tail connector protein n=1 Tax=Terribacillus sp. AE2B 122 TaxID=1331902 RepID=UPI001582434F|nr:head-tail connector protein [Terribacillus sp. AE2B 122]
MATAEELLPEVKEWLRVDGDDENKTILTLLYSAKSILKGSGVPEVTDTDDKELFEQYKLAIFLCVTHFHENRIPVVTGMTAANLPFSLQSIILQLKAGALPHEPRET